MPLAFPDPVLAGAGVTLRGLQAADAAWITVACSNRELSRWIPGIPYPYSESDARSYIERSTRGWAEGTSATFVIAQTTSGAGLGVVGLQLFTADSGLAEVGYWLRGEARGRGAATTAVRLLCRWAFDVLRIERVSLQTAPENDASQKVAERAGFRREGLLRAWMRTPHGRRDSVMFSLLRTDLR